MFTVQKETSEQGRRGLAAQWGREELPIILLVPEGVFASLQPAQGCSAISFPFGPCAYV